MRRIWYGIVVLSLVAGPAAAQPGLGFNLYGGGGVSFPSSDLGDIAKTGYHGLAAFGISPVPSIETVARFAHNSFPVKDGGDEKFTISEYGLDIRANLAAPGFNFRPYALIGGGFAKLSFTQSALDQLVGALKPETKLFYCIGGGIKVNALPKVNFFFEVRYTKLTTGDKNLDNLPISIGLNLAL